MQIKKSRKLRFLMLGILLGPTIAISAETNSDSETEDKIPKVHSWYQAPGSITKDGFAGKIFEASNGDIYVMGRGTRLEVLKHNEAEFKVAPGSITKNGFYGRIFETTSGDIYVMGYGTRLEVLKKGETNFKIAPGSITMNGTAGVIFEASNGDIYVMGFGTGLEVLKKGETNFKVASGSKHTNGYGGSIFETTSGDIYVLGNGTKLEVLKKGETNFKVAPGSKTTTGFVGEIFEAQNGDIYLLGAGTWSRLEVLKKGELNFKVAPGSRANASTNSTILEAQNGDIYVLGRAGSRLEVLKNGESAFKLASFELETDDTPTKGAGTIFQAQNGDIYVVGLSTGLRVVKKGEASFKPVTSSKVGRYADGNIFETQEGDIYVLMDGVKLEVLKKEATNFMPIPSSISTSNMNAKIFQARNGDLYVLGNGTKLEVLKNGESAFKLSPGAIATKGYGASIYQARNGDIYVMGDGTGLEVLKNNDLVFTKTHTTKNMNDGTINIANFDNYYSKLQYKKNGASNWIDVPLNDVISNLSPGRYIFRWKSKDGKKYVGTDVNTEVIAEEQIINNGEKIMIPSNPNFKLTEVSEKGKSDGTITVSNFSNDFSKLQYKKNDATNWIDVPSNGVISNLISGRYIFRWKSKDGEKYVGTEINTKAIAGEQIINNKIAVPSDPTFKLTSASEKGKSDGTITVSNFSNDFSKLQYKENNATNWIDVPSNGVISNLISGRYIFRWKSKNGEKYVGTNETSWNISDEQVIEVAKSTSSNKTVILATTIPLGILSIIGAVLLFKYKFAKK